LLARLNKMNCEIMLTYDTPALRQTGSRNLTDQKRFPRYGVPIWSLWPNIRFLPSIVAEKNATKNEHIQNVCSMCIKMNKVGKQEVGIWWVQKRFPRYGGTYMKLVTKYQISAINSCWEKCDEKCAYMFNVYKKPTKSANRK
jgi:hypothetical protein